MTSPACTGRDAPANPPREIIGQRPSRECFDGVGLSQSGTGGGKVSRRIDRKRISQTDAKLFLLYQTKRPDLHKIFTYYQKTSGSAARKVTQSCWVQGGYVSAVYVDSGPDGYLCFVFNRLGGLGSVEFLGGRIYHSRELVGRSNSVPGSLEAW